MFKFYLTQVSEKISEHLLTLHEKGKSQYTEFVKKILNANEKLFHEPIKRNPKFGFKSLNKKIVLKNKKSVEANRDMLVKLLAICIKQERKIDFQKALTYPLAEVPLALCNADDSMRKSNKSNLGKKVLSRLTDEATPVFEKGSTAVIVEFIALVRTITQVPDTFEGLAMKLISFLPKGFKRIDLIAYSCLQNSIKHAERAN